MRMQRTRSVEHNPKLQGDPEMLTMENMRKRQAIKEHPEMREMVQRWWDERQIVGEGERAGNSMDKEAYMILSVALHKKFVPNVSEMDAVTAASRDWVEDCPEGQDEMYFEDFYSSMFELCDTWIDGTELNGFKHLMREFIART